MLAYPDNLLPCNSIAALLGTLSGWQIKDSLIPAAMDQIYPPPNATKRDK